MLADLDKSTVSGNNSSLAAYVEEPHDVRFVDQEPEEKTLLLLRQHPLTNVPWIFFFVILLLAPLLFTRLLSNTALDLLLLPLKIRVLSLIFWYLCVLGYGILSFLFWFFNIYLVTDRRIVDLDYFGFLFFRLSEAQLYQIQDVTYQMGGIFRILFNYGDVYIQTAAEEREFCFEATPQPARVHDLITDLADTHA